MKILLDYDPQTGMIRDNSGLLIFTWQGLDGHEHKEDKGKDIESLVTLKNAGFDTNEIIELNRKGLV